MRSRFGRLRRKPIPGPLYIAGAFGSASGMGQGARLYAREMAEKGFPVQCLDLTREMRMPVELEAREKPLYVEDLADRIGGTLLLHANPPQFQLALMALPRRFVEHAIIKAYWAWEWEILPPVWRQAMAYVDSIEAPSVFCAETFARYTDKPVSAHPHAVLECARVKNRFCADGKVRCLNIFDAASSLERKNPEAVLELFRRSFRGGEAELTFKVSHAHGKAYRDFRGSCLATEGVKIIEDVKDEEDLDALYLAHDIYISLHRSEGFGLTIKEAMNHGLHVLATGWSGNMDYMSGARCHAAPFRLLDKKWSEGPMRGLKGRWAEPDIEACVGILRELGDKLRKEAALSKREDK